MRSKGNARNSLPSLSFALFALYLVANVMPGDERRLPMVKPVRVGK
jgi:hypothetical protein